MRRWRTSQLSRSSRWYDGQSLWCPLGVRNVGRLGVGWVFMAAADRCGPDGPQRRIVEARRLVHAARRTAVSTNILCKFSSRGRARRLRLVVFLFLFKCINLFVLDYFTPPSY